jgi:asparagine synthase (glutamine-hydrolysing)
LRVADEEKFGGGVGKLLLRRLAERRLPAEVAHAKKSGFAPPVGAWLNGPLAPLVRERLTEAPVLVGAMFERTVLEEMIRRHASGARDHARELWTLLALESWARNYLR